MNFHVISLQLYTFLDLLSIGKAKEEVERNDVSEDDVCWLWNEGFYPKHHLLYKSH